MKKYLVLLLFVIMPVVILAQDLNIPNNIYDQADDYTKSRKAFNRERWFFEQRMYPDNIIPDGAYQKAFDEKMKLRRESGVSYPNANWTNLGPTPGYYFSYGNISSRIVTVKFDPSNPNTIYVGAAYGGIWKSTDGGLNWVSKSDFEVSLSSGALAIDPSNTNIIYYGTGEATYSGASYYGRGLLKSTNGGDSWASITTGLPASTYFSRIVIKPGNSNFLLAALGSSGLYRSTNAGLNWSQLVSGRCDDVVFSPDGTKAFIVGSGVQYHVSTDGGVTFAAVPFTAGLGTRNHIAICNSFPSVLYVSKYSGSAITIYKSTDGGTTYSQISVGTDFSGSQAWYDFYMHVNPFNPNVAYVGAIDIWRTTNGNTFTNNTNGYSGGNVHVDQHNMDFHPTDSNVCISVNDGGIWYSSNKGDSWMNRNAGLTLTQFYRMTSDPSNANHLAGGTQDNGTQRTTGTTNWAAAFGGDGGEVCFHPLNSNYVLGETQNNGVRRSVNNGESWSSATTGLTGSGSWVAPIIAHPDSVSIFYTARGQVFKSTNMGSSWFAISSGTSGTIREMAISNADTKIMFATSGGSVYKSTDRGYTFVLSNSGLPNKTITSINVHPDSSDVALVTMSGFGGNKIHKTTNGGANWFSLNGNLPDSPINDGMFYYPNFATNIILAATDIGVFMTTNSGTNWTEIAEGLPNTVAMHMDYNSASGKLRLGSHGRGTWELNGTLLGITNYNSEAPDKYYLKQNYPNPFNPSTKISFGIVKRGFVTLKVYNTLGREVAVLVNKNLSPGTYETSFRGDNLTSGIYFYKLVSNDFSETKRMMLVK
ncbi:MAG: T9SS type A sorting domain-containing protein [Candidatus Kapaibacterium sp.]